MADLKNIAVLFVFFYISGALDVGSYDADITAEQRNLLWDILEGRFLQEGCTCSEPNVCNCCTTFQGKTGCGKITYNKQSQVFSIELSSAGKTLMTVEVTVQQPQKCQHIVVRGYHAKVCVEIENLHVETTESSGCLTTTISVMGQTQTLKLGCFKMSVSNNKMLQFRSLFEK